MNEFKKRMLKKFELTEEEEFAQYFCIAENRKGRACGKCGKEIDIGDFYFVKPSFHYRTGDFPNYVLEPRSVFHIDCLTKEDIHEMIEIRT